MEQYKHKQTGLIATLMTINYKVGDCEVPHNIIENTNDWELIPEVPNMEVSFCGLKKDAEKNHIFIKNPTPLMKQVVRQIEKGECYDSIFNSSTLKDYIDFNNGFAISIHTSFTSVNRNYKLLIIPMEESEANNE